jgi:putative ABC transport system ATP-binding protein
MNSGPIIETRDLRKTYQVGKVDVPALRGVDLTVKPGEFLAIVGPSGSGKSTLFHIIGGLTPPTSGEVRVAGQDLAAMTEAGRTRLRKCSVAFVFQKFNLLPNLTARDNIAIARHIGGFDSKPEASFEEVLRLLGIANRLDHKPSELSGGEQQRVAIARAIISRPEILILDEPTASLDGDTGRMIIAFVKEKILNEKRCILIVTHDARINEYADRIMHMEDGHLTAMDKGTE